MARITVNPTSYTTNSDGTVTVNFTNKFGKRYASSKTYENQLINIYKYINSSTTIQHKYDIYKHYKILSGK